MFILESIAQAWHSLRGHKLRTGLTMFGIIWGITSVIILVGMGKSSQRLFYQEFEKIGKKMVVVVAGTSTSGLSGIKGGRPVRFTFEDVKAIRDHCPLVELVTPHVQLGFQEVKYGSELISCDTFGFDENCEVIRNMRAASGRFISAGDCESSSRVCLLGANVKEKLFGSRRAVGEFVRLGGIRLRVVGVLAKKGDQISRPFESLDDDNGAIRVHGQYLPFAHRPRCIRDTGRQIRSPACDCGRVRRYWQLACWRSPRYSRTTSCMAARLRYRSPASSPGA